MARRGRHMSGSRALHASGPGAKTGRGKLGRDAPHRLRASCDIARVGALSILAGCMGVSGGSDRAHDAWEAEAAVLEGAQVYDAETLWRGEDQAAEHVPMVQVSSEGAFVAVPHPMTADHWVTAIYLRDQHGVVIAMSRAAQPPAGVVHPWTSVTFEIPHDVTEVTAYAHCNVHDVWRSDLHPMF